MTTEIAVLNRLGIALATDSAVTIGGGANDKVFDTADKLFELSPIFPVALMINGNMDCLGVPWEIIIKDFREAKGSIPKATIKQWMAEFLHFVSQYQELSTIKSDAIITEKIQGMCIAFKNAIMEGLFESVRSKERRDIKGPEDFEAAVKSFLLKLVAEEADVYEHCGRADSLLDVEFDHICNTHAALSDEEFLKQFKPHALSDEELFALKRLGIAMILSPDTTDYTTGIVVAGYGSEGIFPAVESVEIEGKVCDTLKYYFVNSYSIKDAEDEGQVVSFAQTDVIERLLGGADPKFVEKSAAFINQAIVEAGTAIDESLRPRRLSKQKTADRAKMIEEIASAFQEKFEREAAKQLINASTTAFDRMIALMPKQELINLAEALVSITAVERKASSDLGTVGGPIDVALITKHEGFVWIKRKQHFDPSLNPRYFWRRYGRNNTGEGHGSIKDGSQGPGEGEAAGK